MTLILGSVLAVCLALLVDWLGGLAEFYLGPEGAAADAARRMAGCSRRGARLLVADSRADSARAAPCHCRSARVRSADTPGLEGVRITVGSKEYTEQVILGYILEFTLAAAGADVRDLTGIVGSRSTREAQLSGQVDVAYEFTGNAWINYLGHEKPIPDTREQFEAVRDEDLATQRHGVAGTGPDGRHLRAGRQQADRSRQPACAPCPTTPSWSSAIRPRPRTCVDTEFRARQDGYPGMAAAYGFDPAQAQTPILQVGIIYQATADGTQCDFGEVFTTDGRIAGAGPGPC